VATRRAPGWKHPTLPPFAAALPKNFDDSPTHRNEPSSFWSFAIGHEDQPVIPIEILNAHLVEFALISHSGIAHQDDNVAKEVGCSLSPLAISGRSKQYSFGGIIESE